MFRPQGCAVASTHELLVLKDCQVFYVFGIAYTKQGLSAFGQHARFLQSVLKEQISIQDTNTMLTDSC